MGLIPVPHTTTRLLPFFYASGEAPPQQLSPLLSPIRLRAAAHLYNIETVALRGARVLEIDCGLGNNLLPFALAYPEACVVGISLDADDCLAGQTLADNMGAENLHLYALRLDQIDANIGQFDYIIIRRLYGSLAPDAAEVLLQTCTSLLGPQGIACVGYDTYPGAKMAEVVRDAMLMHAHSSSDLTEIAGQAQAALALFGEGMAKSNPQAKMLESSAWKMASQLRHEGVSAVLGNPGIPRYFIEFVGQAAQAGMDYVGDCDALRDLSERWGGNVQLINNVLGLGQAGAMRLQYLDVVTGRSTRHSLLVSAARGTGPRHQPDADRLADLRWAGGWQRQSWGLPDVAGRASFVNHQGKKWTSPDTVSTAILDVLSLAWPGSVSFSALQLAVERVDVRNQDGKADIGAHIRFALLQMMQEEIVHYCLDEGPYDAPAAQRLSLLPSLAYLSEQQTKEAGDENGAALEKIWFPFNLWHELLADSLNASERQQLTQMSKGEGLAAQASQGRVEQAFQSFGETGLVIKTDGLLQAELVNKLASMGGVLADAVAWRDFLLANLKRSEGTVPYWGLYLASIERYALHEGESKNMDTPEPSSLTPQQTAQIKRAEQLLMQLNYVEAEALALQLIKRLPDLIYGYVILARCQAETNRYVDAFSTLSKIASARRWKIDFLVDLVSLLAAQRLQSDAVRAGQLALMLDARHARMLNVLGLVCMQTFKLQEAEQYFARAIKADPEIFTARLNQLAVLSRQGKVREGIDVGHLALQDRTKEQSVAYRAAVHHNLLFLSNYDPDRSAEEIFQDYQNFETEICRPLYGEWKRHKNNRKTNRRLRIGYVSPDYRNHAVARFLEPIFASHDKSSFEIVAYSDVKSEDAVTEKFKTMADRWVSIVGLNDSTVAARIRTDEIDILVDLAGHTGGNRLGMFARKPAPVSITWLGYGYTTGVSAIDYFIGDEHYSPPGCEHLFAEKIWRLPRCSGSYRPRRAEMGDMVTELPALKNGFITLVSLSRSIRINHRVIRVWAKIMTALPNARLVVNSESYADSRVCAELHEKFQAYGVEPNRVFLGYSSPPWQTLRESDIGLDCFPHNAGTTLMDMLCFGVPFVTLADRPSVGRIGAANLHGAGHPEWIAQTEDQYVEKVLELAQDVDKLSSIRQSLYEEIKSSPMLDEAGFVKDLELAYIDMFGRWAKS